MPLDLQIMSDATTALPPLQSLHTPPSYLYLIALGSKPRYALRPPVQDRHVSSSKQRHSNGGPAVQARRSDVADHLAAVLDYSN